MSWVERLEHPGEESRRAGPVFEQVVVGGGRMQPPLGIQHVLAPGLVEPHRDIMLVLRQFLLTRLGESPRASPAWSSHLRQAMIVNGRRQGIDVPTAGVEVDGMPIARETVRQVANVVLTPTARRQDALIAQCYIHLPLLE